MMITLTMLKMIIIVVTVAVVVIISKFILIVVSHQVSSYERAVGVFMIKSFCLN